MPSLTTELRLSADEAAVALRQAVEEWGGIWDESTDPEEIALPIRAGIREGYARLIPSVTALGDGYPAAGSTVSLEVREESLRINRGAMAVLLFGALGGVLTVIWPLHPALLSLAPMGALLALLAWLLVASRFRSSGPTEFLDGFAAGATGQAVDEQSERK